MPEKHAEEMFFSLGTRLHISNIANTTDITWKVLYIGFNIHFCALREPDGLLRNAVITQCLRFRKERPKHITDVENI